MRYWTPLQRVHQMNEYFSMKSEYRNFGFWLKFAQLFFDPTPNTLGGVVEDMTWMRINVEGGELFEIPLISVGRLFYLWALEGATQFRWQLDSVQEQMTANNLHLECQMTWSVDYDGGLSVCRQSGPCRLVFRNGAAALISDMEWCIREWRVFYAQGIAGLVSPVEERMPYGFPKPVVEFLTQCSVTADALMVKELGQLLISAKYEVTNENPSRTQS